MKKLTHLDLHRLDLLDRLLDLGGVLRVLPPGLLGLGDLLLEEVLGLVQVVDAPPAFPPLVVKVDDLTGVKVASVAEGS